MGDDGNPAKAVADAVERCRALARTWHGWDAPRGEAWTLREIAEHVANVTWYAEQAGSLA